MQECSLNSGFYCCRRTHSLSMRPPNTGIWDNFASRLIFLGREGVSHYGGLAGRRADRGSISMDRYIMKVEDLCLWPQHLWLRPALLSAHQQQCPSSSTLYDERIPGSWRLITRFAPFPASFPLFCAPKFKYRIPAPICSIKLELTPIHRSVIIILRTIIVVVFSANGCPN